MIRKLLTLAALLPLAASAQTVSTFEALTLPKQDTFYVNYTMPGKDVGFINGLAHFPTVYDTSFGAGFWSSGFVYSNMRDTATSGYMNQYSAKTGSGYGGSANYAVAYGQTNRGQLLGSAKGRGVTGFYVTNSTYAYNDMRSGSTFSKKFGGTTGNDPDFFKLVVRGYQSGSLKSDSVEFYLADYRFNNQASDYIVKDWSWVDLMPLGHVDSLLFTLSSSDVGQFGINTPLYFCMDNFTTNETGLGVHNAPAYSARVYPMPAHDVLYVEDASGDLREAMIVDAAGKVLYNAKATGTRLELPLQNMAAGVYFLQLRTTDGRSSTVRFVKQ